MACFVPTLSIEWQKAINNPLCADSNRRTSENHKRIVSFFVSIVVNTKYALNASFAAMNCEYVRRNKCVTFTLIWLTHRPARQRSTISVKWGAGGTWNGGMAINVAINLHWAVHSHRRSIALKSSLVPATWITHKTTTTASAQTESINYSFGCS